MLDQRAILLSVATVTLEMCHPLVKHTCLMLLYLVLQVSFEVVRCFSKSLLCLFSSRNNNNNIHIDNVCGFLFYLCVFVPMHVCPVIMYALLISTMCFLWLYISTITECQLEELKCTNGRVNGQLHPCISAAQRCDGVTDCIGGEDELDHNCPCGPEGAVRLVDGTVPYRGRVEFCKSGWWSTICSYYQYYWDNTDAAVVCHQLGYPRAGMHQITAHNAVLCVCWFIIQ